MPCCWWCSIPWLRTSVWPSSFTTCSPCPLTGLAKSLGDHRRQPGNWPAGPAVGYEVHRLSGASTWCNIGLSLRPFSERRERGTLKPWCVYFIRMWCLNPTRPRCAWDRGPDAGSSGCRVSSERGGTGRAPCPCERPGGAGVGTRRQRPKCHPVHCRRRQDCCYHRDSRCESHRSTRCGDSQYGGLAREKRSKQEQGHMKNGGQQEERVSLLAE